MFTQSREAPTFTEPPAGPETSLPDAGPFPKVLPMDAVSQRFGLVHSVYSTFSDQTPVFPVAF